MSLACERRGIARSGANGDALDVPRARMETHRSLQSERAVWLAGARAGARTTPHQALATIHKHIALASAAQAALGRALAHTLVPNQKSRTFESRAA